MFLLGPKICGNPFTKNFVRGSCHEVFSVYEFTIYEPKKWIKVDFFWLSETLFRKKSRYNRGTNVEQYSNKLTRIFTYLLAQLFC